MTASRWLEEIIQIKPYELEVLLNLARAVIFDEENLTWQDRDVLLSIIVEKIKDGIYQL